MSTNKTAMGLQENIAALLTYVMGFVSGIIFLVLEKDNKVVRFHAMQSTVTFLPLFVLGIVISRVPVIGMFAMLVGLLELILWIILMIKAYQGEMFRLPIAADIADNLLNKPAAGQGQGSAQQPTPAAPTPQQPKRPQPKGQGKFCQGCGSPAKPGDRFCEKCGKPV